MNWKIFFGSEILIGSTSTIVSSSLSIVDLSIGIPIAISSALNRLITILITNEYFWKLKRRYTEIGDWIKVLRLQYEKSMKQSMIDEKNDDRDAQEGKKYNIIWMKEAKWWRKPNSK